MTEKQAVANLKAELAKVKEEARLAREAAEKAVAASYDRGVRDTEIRLTEDTLSIREVVAQAKEAVPGPQVVDGQPGPTQGSDLGK